MRNPLHYFCSVALSVMAATAMSLTLSGQYSAANAQGRNYAKNISSSGVHQSVLRISNNQQLPMTKIITLSRNKSMLVEMPRQLRDVLVSNPALVDAVVQTANRVYLIGKNAGQANVFFFDTQGERILTLEVQIEVDTRPLDAMLRRFIPGSNIRTETLNETLILTGTVRNPDDSTRAEALAGRFANTQAPQSEAVKLAKVINMLVVEGEEQVMLRVKFAEVQRTALKQFGVNIGGSVNNGTNITTITTQNSLPVTTAEGLNDLGQIVGWPLTVSGVGSGIGGALATANNARQLAYTLRALERNGLVRTLAEPNLTAVSGESANFLAGGEFPIPVASEDEKVTIAFKEFGVGLAFTPVVLSEGRISLKISTEVSELSTNGAVTFGGIAIPALTKRKTESTVELPSGGTLAMSGLVQSNIQRNIDGFPGLKELPILGTLFRSTDFVNEETELIVIVTPYIVRPTSRDKIVSPTDGLAPATDQKAYLLGHLNRIHGRAVALPVGSVKDSYGFIVE